MTAWKCYQKDHNHGSPEGYTLLGNVQYALGKFREAAESYTKALELDPGYQQALNNLAVIRSRMPSAAGVRITGVEPGKAR